MNQNSVIVASILVGLGVCAGCGSEDSESYGEPCLDHELCPDSAYKCICDDGGNLLYAKFHLEYDDQNEFCGRWIYNDSGSIVVIEEDDYCDGVVNVQYIYTYNQDNHPATLESDFDGDGTANLLTVWNYSEGLLESKEIDQGANGTVNLRCFYEPPCVPQCLEEEIPFCDPGSTCESRCEQQ